MAGAWSGGGEPPGGGNRQHLDRSIHLALTGPASSRGEEDPRGLLQVSRPLGKELF